MQAVTTPSSDAADSLSKAVTSFIYRQPDTTHHLQKALEHDPQFALAHAVSGLMLFGARSVSLTSLAHDALLKAQQHRGGVNHRESLYIEALELVLSGQLKAAVKRYETILETHPTDALALALAQSELFWLGDMQWSERISASVDKYWTPDVPAYTAYLAIRAFDLEELNQFGEAERVARESVELDPGNIWGTHAIAHIMLMQNRIDEGSVWMRERQHLWTSANQMQFHLAWHQCLFLLEQNAQDEILDIYDKRVRNRQHALCEALPDLYIDIQNAASLLWRLEKCGVNVGNRWEELAEVMTPRIDDMSNPFTSAHTALVLTATGQHDDCQRLLDSMQSFSQDASHDLASRYADAAIPCVQAVMARSRDDHAAVVRHLAPARTALWQMGGSHAQQDIFHQLLADSARKLGDEELFASLLKEIEQIGFTAPLGRAGYQHG